MRRVRSLLPLALPFLGACGLLQPELIRGSDDGTLFPGARVTWDLVEPSPAEEPRTATRMQLELDLSYQSSSFEQDLSGGSVQVDGTYFTGSSGAPLAVDYDLWRGSLACRIGVRSATGVAFDLIGGLGASALSLQASNGVNSARANIEDLGPLLGLGLSGQATPWLGFYAEARWYGGLAEDSNFTEIEVFDLGLSLGPWRATRLLIGLRQLEYETEENLTLNSEMDLGSSGVFATLAFTF